MNKSALAWILLLVLIASMFFFASNRLEAPVDDNIPEDASSSYNDRDTDTLLDDNSKDDLVESGNKDDEIVSPQPKAEPEPQKPIASKQCFVGGCSNHVCSDQKDVVTTCEWREEYACYQKATCEVQVSGDCGWTETRELNQCLSDSRTGTNI